MEQPAPRKIAPNIDAAAMASLPADDIVAPLLASLESTHNAVVIAPPGAGKTTRLPPAIATATFIKGQTVMLQPRRVAARAAAARIAEERRWRIGEEVGWQIRFDNCTGPRTRLRVVTEGILARQLLADPFLEGVGCVILDEFHERSIHTDLALALLRDVQTSVREDLRIVVMSATLDPGPVQEYLGGAPLFRSEGRLFPVDVEFSQTTATAQPIHERMAAAVRRSVDADSGHVLAFLPGIGEIRRTEELLRGADGDVHVLHSSVTAEEQDRALRPSTARKIVLATNIAETSITIDGVRTVIDSGLARVPVQDAALGIDRLELRRISRASADQRAGRAGRTAPGRCVRLWTKQEDGALDPFETPELLRVDLAPTLLSLAAFGIGDVASFRWFQPPPPERVERAQLLLRQLGAFDSRGALTALGRRLSAMPLHPRIGAVLLAAERLGHARDGATVAALLSEREAGAARDRSDGPRWHSESDVLDAMDALPRGGPLAQRIAQVREDLLRHVDTAGRQAAPRDEALRRAILAGYPDRVTVRRANDASRGLMVGGRGIVLDPSSAVRTAPLFISVEARDAVIQGKTEARVAFASAIEESWLAEDFPHLYTTGMHCRYDAERARVLATKRTAFGDIALREDIAGAPADLAQAVAAFGEYLRGAAEELVSRDEDAACFVARMTLVREHAPDADLPEPDARWLGAALADSLERETSMDAFARTPLAERLANALPWNLRRTLDELAPTTFEVPSESRIRIKYERGAAPVLAVRLQELFGLAETPRIVRGRVPLLLHLLAPNYRPAQVTADLRNFWNTTYFEVRKELRARYPKHPWPDDPWNAPPVAVGRRRRPS